MKRPRLLMWAGLVTLVVLGGRELAYALSPSPLASALAGQAGGPRLPVVALVSLVLAVAASAAIVSLAALGVRERRLLEDRPTAEEPLLRLGLLVGRTAALAAASMLGFALLESYLHWRAGLGWHGLHCLTGPVHRDAIPILGALSLVAAALIAALDHVLAWMRRTLASLAPRRPLISPVALASKRPAPDVPAWRPAGAQGARAPPALA